MLNWYYRIQWILCIIKFIICRVVNDLLPFLFDFAMELLQIYLIISWFWILTKFQVKVKVSKYVCLCWILTCALLQLCLGLDQHEFNGFENSKSRSPNTNKIYCRHLTWSLRFGMMYTWKAKGSSTSIILRTVRHGLQWQRGHCGLTPNDASSTFGNTLVCVHFV